MRNKREIILDFTSLLDVTMLILFFFVIFAQFDTNNAMNKVEEMQAEAQKMQTEAEQRQAEADGEWEKANNVLQQAEVQLNEFQQASTLAEAVIINGGADFEKALRLKLVLYGDRDDWFVSVQFAEEKDNEILYTEIGKINDIRSRKADDTVNDLEKIIVEYGYSKVDAFLCDLIYNSAGAGSRAAKNNTDDMLKSFQNDLGYKYLFASTTDLSEMEND